MHYFAHSLPNEPTENWEPLNDHLQRVGHLAAQFGKKFGAEQYGRLSGLWHDLGKYSTAFQDYLLTANGFAAHIEHTAKVDHSTAGAQHAANTVPTWGKLLAYIIAGHHAGLADAGNTSTNIDYRLNKPIEPIPDAPDELLNVNAQAPLGVPPLDFNRNEEAIANTVRHGV